MTIHHFADRLTDAIREKRTPALVGIDPRFDQLPDSIRESCLQRFDDELSAKAAAFEEFSIGLIDVVAPLVPAVKPQAAFFEELGAAGMVALSRVIQHARDSGLVVVLDAKRGDIGSTAEAYARGWIAGSDSNSAPWGADSLTVNAYLGRDTLDPFVRTSTERGGGIFVLVRTSNPGSAVFQDRETDGTTLYQTVGDNVESLAAETVGESGFGAVGAVVGATYPRELAELRERMPHAILLVPGYGSQGGSAADTAGAFNDDGLGAIINSSRGINFAFRREPYSAQFLPEQWQDAVAAATKDMIDDLATHTPAGRLR